MARFGGNTFTSFSVPLAFAGRYFVLEPSVPPLLSVFLEVDGKIIFEVLKNQAVANSVSEVTSNGTDVVTITDPLTKKFLYKVRPGSETSIVFGMLSGVEVQAQITDRKIQVGGIKIQNSVFHGVMSGVLVDPNGSVSIGAPLPPAVVRLMSAS